METYYLLREYIENVDQIKDTKFPVLSQELENGEKLLWKWDEAGHFVFFTWPENVYTCVIETMMTPLSVANFMAPTISFLLEGMFPPP